MREDTLNHRITRGEEMRKDKDMWPIEGNQNSMKNNKIDDPPLKYRD